MISGSLPTREQVRWALDKKLSEMQYMGEKLDVIPLLVMANQPCIPILLELLMILLIFEENFP
jgi:hypothetical protein